MKFKVGDLIRVSDPKDENYTINNFYEIVEIKNNDYILQSKRSGLKHTTATFKGLGLFDDKGNFTTLKEWCDENYRLVTPAEKVLYG